MSRVTRVIAFVAIAVWAGTACGGETTDPSNARAPCTDFCVAMLHAHCALGPQAASECDDACLCQEWKAAADCAREHDYAFACENDRPTIAGCDDVLYALDQCDPYDP